MASLSTELRNKLERTVISARNLAEEAAASALKSFAVDHYEPFGHMTPEHRQLRNRLRARARQLGDKQTAKDFHEIVHIVQECAYEHWHRMLFARFLAENNLLIEPESKMAISLDECKELAKEEKTDVWTLAGRYAQKMLPEIFRPDDPLLQIPLAKEHQIKLESLLDTLPSEVFTASDSLGWCYQFWQTERKKQVNDSGNKIGADELPAVTQLFTEDYMVDFLLDNTIGAWWAGKQSSVIGEQLSVAKTEEECRNLVALPGCPWKYLRFIKGEDENWCPAAGSFDGWPTTAKELKCLDPCMGSGHFVVGMFDRMVPLRMAEEKLNEKDAVSAVIRDNLFGLEIDPRCTQIGAFNLALAAWRRIGYCSLAAMHIACSGLAPNSREEDWVKLAGNNEKLRLGMERLHQLFKKGPVLGSLINPKSLTGNLLEASFHEIQPLLETALAQETKDDNIHEMAVTARGLAKAAEILASKFSLVATNVPYLGRGKQDEILQDYCEFIHPQGKGDLATCFLERCLDFCGSKNTVSLVMPWGWTFATNYQTFREALLQTKTFRILAKLGEGGFASSAAAGAFVVTPIISNELPHNAHVFISMDASIANAIDEKESALREGKIIAVNQKRQLDNPDSRILFEERSNAPMLSQHAQSFQGIKTGDDGYGKRYFWELPSKFKNWKWFQSTVEKTVEYGGCEYVLRWENGGADIARLQGQSAWGKIGVAVSLMRELRSCVYFGEVFDSNVAAVVVENRSLVLPLWAYCSSGQFDKDVRVIDPRVNAMTGSLTKIPFDLSYWQKVAAEKYPNGLPKPHSSDPTQWLFNGHPKDSDQPLQVAVARLLGYQWPRQTGGNFPDCPALKPDGLEKLADEDGIVCIPSVRGEEPAADRLRKLLSKAYGKEWKPGSELEFIHATGSSASDFDEWLRNDFFEQHCTLFHQRPFVWHIWDGRKRDGFHALINYHKLAEGDGNGRKVLESLTHSYLNDWIIRQKDSVKRGEEGAEERLAAALELKKRLELILEGEPPFDIFIRWKPLDKQAIGWEPDINDGVRMNIRPFMASDLPNSKRGAGILRTKPNIKWDKDRGKEPNRDKKDFPWFWSSAEFTGDRVNDIHLTREQKEKAKGG